MKTLKAGIVGTRFIGGRHMDAIRRIPGVRIGAVVDADGAKAAEIARELGAKFYTDVDAMLEEEDLDVIHNCTPTNMHYPINEKVIWAGIHLYCEKPLTLSGQERGRLLELLKKHPVANGVNLNYRVNALVQDMCQRVKRGEYGRPFLVTGSYIQDWMMKEDDYDWRLDPKAGGASRAVADIGSICLTPASLSWEKGSPL